MSGDVSLDKLASFHIFRGMTLEQLEALADIVEVHSYSAGEIIFREGDESDYLYVVDTGQVEVVKGEEALTIATLQPGEDFGSMPLFEEAPRSATVRALTSVTVIRVSFDAIDRIGIEKIQPNDVSLERRSSSRHHQQKSGILSPFHQVLIKNLFQQQTINLRKTNELTVNSLKNELSETQMRLAMSTFLTYVISMACFYGFFLRDMVQTVHQANPTWASSSILAAYAGALFFMVKRSPYPLSFYGFNLYHWKSALRESLMWSTVFIAVVVMLKGALITWIPGYQDLKLISPVALDREHFFVAISYATFIPVQEFIARGILQSSFQKFLSGKFVTAKAIAFSTLLFSSTHLHLSTAFAVVVVIPSIFWGIMYARQKTLLGVILSHWIIGEGILLVIGFPRVVA